MIVDCNKIQKEVLQGITYILILYSLSFSKWIIMHAYVYIVLIQLKLTQQQQQHLRESHLQYNGTTESSLFFVVEEKEIKEAGN